MSPSHGASARYTSVKANPGCVRTIRYGTCSWSEKSWVSPFYPAGTKPGDNLKHYGTRFDSVEADSTYYACPPADRVRNGRR